MFPSTILSYILFIILHFEIREFPLLPQGDRRGANACFFLELVDILPKGLPVFIRAPFYSQYPSAIWTIFHLYDGVGILQVIVVGHSVPYSVMEFDLAAVGMCTHLFPNERRQYDECVLSILLEDV